MKEKKNARQLIKNCFQCQQEIAINYNSAVNEYAKKNNWYYWTENEKNQGKYICNSCLLDYYYEKPKEYLKLVENKRKRRILTTYVYNKTIS